MPVRLAVVGAGPLVGLPHCNAIKHLASTGVELACICDLPEHAAATARQLGVPCYSDAAEMARKESLDGVVISAPTHLHLPLVEKCIAGAQARSADLAEECSLKAVLVEKPICQDLASALRLVQVAESAGVSVLVGHQRRHSAYVKKAREMVTSSDFGPLRGLNAEFALLKPESYFQPSDPRVGWRCQKDKGGPLLINLIHDVDLLRHITGHEVSSVFASTSTSGRGFEVEDTGAVTVVLSGGAVGTFFFSDAAPSPWSYEFTTGENKKYPALPSSDATDCYHFMGAKQSLAFPSLRRFRYGKEVHEAGWDAPLTLEREQVLHQDPILVQMEHFAQVCRGEAEPLCSGRDGIESLAVLMAVLRSAETQAPVSPKSLLEEATEAVAKCVPAASDGGSTTTSQADSPRP